MDILLKSSNVVKDEASHLVLKVKSKGRKNSKKNSKTPLESLAKGERERDERGAFILDANGRYKVLSNKDKYKRFQPTKVKGERVLIKGKNYIYKSSFESTYLIHPNRKILSIKTIGEGNAGMMDTVNNLLRNILLFKGIGFAEISEIIKTSGAATFTVNTLIDLRYLYDITKVKNVLNSAEIKVNKITVKRCEKVQIGEELRTKDSFEHQTFTNDKGETVRKKVKVKLNYFCPVFEYRILFCSKTCKDVKQQLAGTMPELLKQKIF